MSLVLIFKLSIYLTWCVSRKYCHYVLVKSHINLDWTGDWWIESSLLPKQDRKIIGRCDVTMGWVLEVVRGKKESILGLTEDCPARLSAQSSQWSPQSVSQPSTTSYCPAPHTWRLSHSCMLFGVAVTAGTPVRPHQPPVASSSRGQGLRWHTHR